MKTVKINYIIPNFITSMNMLLGFSSIIMSIKGNYLMASWLIIFAIVADGLDGKAARMLNGFSEFGKELDSFSDALSFGMAPAILIFSVLSKENVLKEFVFIASFLFVLASILRLARFNITTVVSKEKGDFIGMPTPTAAGLVSSYCIFSYAIKELISNNILSINFLNQDILKILLPETSWVEVIFPTFFLIMVAMNIILMVSNVTFCGIAKSFGIKNMKLGLILLVLLAIFGKYLLFPAGYTYFLINFIKYINSILKRKE